MTKQEYAQWTQEESPKSKGPMNILKAFVFGGGICAIGQLLVFFYQSRGAGELGFVFASLSLVVLSAVLTGLNVYDNIAKHAGRRNPCSHHWICKLDGKCCNGV